MMARRVHWRAALAKSRYAAVLALFVLLGFLPARTCFAVDISIIKATVGGVDINVFFYQPDGAGPFPLLILSHGSPRAPEDRVHFGPQTFHVQAEAYADGGVAVAVPIRRGYAGQGQYAEGFGDNINPDFYDAGLATADDIDAAIAAVLKRPDIDPSRVVLMGVSAGGWGSIAAATRGGVLGVVNFAGGRGSVGPNDVPGAATLVQAAARYGAASHVPELWIYSQNDQFFGPPLAHQLFDAFNGAGGKAAFIAAPPYRNDGHTYIAAINDWKPEVDQFLRKIGFLK